MFSKILIANRGEIAVRIIRTAREMNIATVAVYSDCDRPALHVRLADEAYGLGASPSVESYLNMDRILQAAEASGAEAIHPGYGFLAENAEFARRCQDRGICFIGPSPRAMELMGEKTAARKLAVQAGVPVVPGTGTQLGDSAELERAAHAIGFPVLVKAAAGGGGKGMRLVSSPDRLASAIRDARSEAGSAFGNPAVYLEKYLQGPRHIEFQILADGLGNTVHLGERECSIQRRHQKVIEECPSPVMTEALRAGMGQAAVKMARACGYLNAGTVEFLVDSQQDFYFLEMNTRLQVEHPVTEMVTGLDLVRKQIQIAAGQPLGLRQEEVCWRGAALECRIYAEDPENGFLPSPGLIRSLRQPSGPGVREDSGIYQGWEVPIFYDPMLSKLVTWAENRAEAISRMNRALGEYQISGIKTTIPFFQTILSHPKFLSAELSTDFIEKFYRPTRSLPHRKELREVAAVGAALFASRARASEASRRDLPESPWKLWGRWNGLRK